MVNSRIVDYDYETMSDSLHYIRRGMRMGRGKKKEGKGHFIPAILSRVKLKCPVFLR